jgi:hypothetical protein
MTIKAVAFSFHKSSERKNGEKGYKKLNSMWMSPSIFLLAARRLHGFGFVGVKILCS